MIPRFKPSLGWGEFRALFRFRRNVVQKFEVAFAGAFHSKTAVAFSYGRSAQWAFFKALGISNAEIIMPAYTCSVVAHAVTLSGNIPRFVDIVSGNYNMNLELIQSLINQNTRAVIATHTFGYPENVERIADIVKDAEKKYGNKIWIIQDCCHSFGATWKGRPVSMSGDVAVYAFNISKIMTSIFGGMLTFQDEELGNKVRKWRDENYKKAGFLKTIKRRLYLLAIYVAFNEKIYGFTWWLQEKTPILNALTKSFHLDEKIHFPPDYLEFMLDVEAEVGLVQLTKYPSIIENRRKNALWYDQNLKKREGWTFPPIVEGATYSHFAIHVQDRKKVVDEMAKNGIHIGELIQYSIPNMSTYNVLKDQCPISLVCSKTTINMPVTIDNLIIEKYRDAFNKIL